MSLKEGTTTVSSNLQPTHHATDLENAIMPTVCANAEGVNSIIPIRILLDCGSTSNFISVSAAKNLKHDIIEDNFEVIVNTIHGKKVRIFQKISFFIGTKDFKWKQKIHAYVIDHLMTLPPIQTSTDSIKQMCKFKDIVFNETYPQTGTQEVGLLLGVTDMVRVSGKKQIYLSDTLVLLHTRWGYVLMGAEKLERQNPTLHTSSSGSVYAVEQNPTTHISAFTKTELLTKQVEKMWHLEKLPFDDDKSGMSKEEVDAVHLIDKNLKYNLKQKRFETNLLFKNAPKFQNNFRQAKARLDAMLRKMKGNLDIQQGYNDVINEYLSAGIIEEVNDEKASDPNRTDLFYLKVYIRFFNY